MRKSIGDEKTPAQVVSALNEAGVDQECIKHIRWGLDGKLCLTLKAISSGAKAVASLDKEDLLKAYSIEHAAEIVQDIMMKRVAAAVMIPEGKIASNRPLEAYGESRLGLPRNFNAS